MICTMFVVTRMRRLSNLSATVPPYIVRASMGMALVKLTRPSMIALLVRPVITQLCAMVCIQVPVMEMVSPTA